MFFESITRFLRNVRHTYFLHYFHFGKNIRIDANVKIYNAGDISLGDSVHLQDGVWLNVIQTQHRKVLTIGDHCDIGRHCFITAKESVILEHDVLLAPNVFISDNSHRYDDLTQPIGVQETTTPKPIRIGEGSWIGINCVILPGVTIGKHCVIGANSVVNTSIPDFCVAAGSPARIVKRLRK